MKSEPVEIRSIGLDQLDALLELEKACFDYDRFSRRNLRHLLRSPSAYCVGVYKGDNLIGNLVVLFHRNTRSARLYSIAVLPSARRMGIGCLLLRDAEREARERGCVRMRLEVRLDNMPAIRLYEQFGFQDVQMLPGIYEDGTHGMLYRKELEPVSARMLDCAVST